MKFWSLLGLMGTLLVAGNAWATNYVGIGTTSPGYPLTINTVGTGTLGIQTTDFVNGSAGTLFYQGLGALTGNTYGVLQVASAGNTTGYNLALNPSGGNVGIGTTSPSYNLHIVGANGTQLGLDNTGQEWTQIDFRNNGVANKATLAWDNTNSEFDIFTNGSQRVSVTSAGNVGIGITNPSYTLHVVGTAGLSTGTAWTNASDIRLKDLHGDYEYGLDEVLKLHTVRFTYKKDNPLGLPSDHPMTGFIAQEVEKVIPDAVHENKNGYLELNVDPIHWAVVNAVKELKALIDGIYERLAGHDQAIADLALAKDRDIASVKADAAAKDAAKDQKIKQLEQENAAIKAYLCGKDPSAAICQ